MRGKAPLFENDKAIQYRCVRSYVCAKSATLRHADGIEHAYGRSASVNVVGVYVFMQLQIGNIHVFT